MTLTTPANWQFHDNKLIREYKFLDYKTALEFVNKVADIAENMTHHPDIYLSWAKVIISITTHDSGNQVTPKDIELANRINHLM
jgi:4a-hydroxytetrahydrobiopterin dehydratase